jgi:hypothetical protein
METTETDPGDDNSGRKSGGSSMDVGVLVAIILGSVFGCCFLVVFIWCVLAKGMVDSLQSCCAKEEAPPIHDQPGQKGSGVPPPPPVRPGGEGEVGGTSPEMYEPEGDDDNHSDDDVLRGRHDTLGGPGTAPGEGGAPSAERKKSGKTTFASSLKPRKKSQPMTTGETDDMRSAYFSALGGQGMGGPTRAPAPRAGADVEMGPGAAASGGGVYSDLDDGVAAGVDYGDDEYGYGAEPTDAELSPEEQAVRFVHGAPPPPPPPPGAF